MPGPEGPSQLLVPLAMHQPDVPREMETPFSQDFLLPSKDEFLTGR